MACAREPQEEVGPLGIVLWPELDCELVIPRRGREGIEGEGTVPCVPERDSRGLRQRLDVLAGRTRVLDRGRIVVSHHLRVVLGAAERLDPLCSGQVLVRALRTRDLLVRDVADERVPKDVLVLACDRAPPLAAHELLARERVQSVLERPPLAAQGA